MMSVLVASDEPETLEHTQEVLDAVDEPFDVTSVSDAKAAIEHISRKEADVIVSGCDLVERDPHTFFDAVRRRNADAPVVLCAADGAELGPDPTALKETIDLLWGDAEQSPSSPKGPSSIADGEDSEESNRTSDKWRTILERLVDVTLVVDKGGRIEYLSPNAGETFDCQPDELTGEFLFDFVRPGDRSRVMEAFFAAVEDQEQRLVVNCGFGTSETGWQDVELRGRSCPTEEGFVITAREEPTPRESEGGAAHRNDRIRDAYRILTHDLRNPLSVASDALALYRETYNDEYLEKIESSVERLEELLNHAMALSDTGARIEETERVSLEDVTRNAWEMIDPKRATLQMDSSTELVADSQRLQQILENLIRNAVEHSDEPVHVRIGTTDDGIYVADNGPGIPEENRDDIFEPGYTTEHDQTGYGLHIVDRIVRAHGWEITVTESIEDGARFELTGIRTAPFE